MASQLHCWQPATKKTSSWRRNKSKSAARPLHLLANCPLVNTTCIACCYCGRDHHGHHHGDHSHHHDQHGHLLVACPLVNTTGMLLPWSDHWSKKSLSSIIASQLVFRHILLCVESPGHDDEVGGDLNWTVTSSMPHFKRPWLGRWAVHWNPLCASWVLASNEKDPLLLFCTAVALPWIHSLHQVFPRSIIVDLTTVSVADNELARDEVCSWALADLSWKVIELTARLLWVGCGPELNRCGWRQASNEQDSWKLGTSLLPHVMLLWHCIFCHHYCNHYCYIIVLPSLTTSCSSTRPIWGWLEEEVEQIRTKNNLKLAISKPILKTVFKPNDERGNPKQTLKGFKSWDKQSLSSVCMYFHMTPITGSNVWTRLAPCAPSWINQLLKL